jgi:hypothetical protein
MTIRALESGVISPSFGRFGTAKLILFFLADGTDRQIIKDADGNMPRPKIRPAVYLTPLR